MATMAGIFEFDDTLLPDTASACLEKHSIDTSKFWGAAKDLIGDGYDPPLAYLKLLLDEAGPGTERKG